MINYEFKNTDYSHLVCICPMRLPPLGFPSAWKDPPKMCRIVVVVKLSTMEWDTHYGLTVMMSVVLRCRCATETEQTKVYRTTLFLLLGLFNGSSQLFNAALPPQTVLFSYL